jgi:hypothetical protein
MDKAFDRSISDPRSRVAVSGSKRESPDETEGTSSAPPKSTKSKRQKLSDSLTDGNGVAMRGVAKREIPGLLNDGVSGIHSSDLPSHSHPMQDRDEAATPIPVRGFNQSTLGMRETRSRTQKYLLAINRYSITGLRERPNAKDSEFSKRESSFPLSPTWDTSVNWSRSMDFCLAYISRC